MLERAAARGAAHRVPARGSPARSTPSAESKPHDGPLDRLGRAMSVHLKIDTGMHRVGADPADAVELARLIDAGARARPRRDLHPPRGRRRTRAIPSPDCSSTASRRSARRSTAPGSIPALLHAANSAGAIAHRRARLDLVRVGIAAYGELPSPALAPVARRSSSAGEALRPVLSLRSSVHLVRRLRAGERTSYGQLYRLERDSTVVTVPIGYADGVPRSLAAGGGEVLIGGRRRPIAGTVTMDQLIVDCRRRRRPHRRRGGADRPQGDEEITASEWAERTGTIAYEILCRLGTRIPRRVARAE